MSGRWLRRENTTPEATAALRGLQALPGNLRHAVIQEAYRAEDRKTRWAEAWGLRETRGCVAVCRLWGRQPSLRPFSTQDREEALERAPGADHATLWTFQKKPACYVSQPYGLDGETLAALVALAQERNLVLRIDARPAWHYPGEVLHVELWHRAAYEAALRARDERAQKNRAAAGEVTVRVTGGKP